MRTTTLPERKAHSEVLRLERWLANHCDEWDSDRYARKQEALEDALMVERIANRNYAA